MNWQKYVRTVTPYVPGEQPKQEKMIKLNTNECPYPPAPGVMEGVTRLNGASLRLYPDPDVGALTGGLADYHGVKKEQVFVGVGSDDVLALAFLTFFNSDRPILFPDITYSFYDVWANLYRIGYQTIPLDEDFRMRAVDYQRENGGIIFPNPNAPTGVEEAQSLIEEIVSSNTDSIVIVDEAYIDFGGTSCLSLIDRYSNLLVVRTFSKSRALAGLRIGYAIGNERLIGYLKDVRFSFNSYTMNLPAQEVGVASIVDEGYFNQCRQRIMATREWVKVELSRLGFTFPDSKGNFIFATHEQVPAAELFAFLKGEGIYVRYWQRPRIDNYLRITVGTDEEMRAFINALEGYLSKP
ncbi:MAG: histidinol-phosphate transaminase [Lachnospiraceae bacterium]|jgi:histidinol-phosphate aminotransferase|nr:histidinol-phosphate transaminase [Lachnospiraceae bacterium]